MPGLDPLEDGVPGHAAGEEGWADTTGDAATDAITFEDGSADALADEDGASDSATGDEAEVDITSQEDLFGTRPGPGRLGPDMATVVLMSGSIYY